MRRTAVDHLGRPDHHSDRAAGLGGHCVLRDVTAVASTGYLASTSTDVGPQNATSQVDARPASHSRLPRQPPPERSPPPSPPRRARRRVVHSVACTNLGMTNNCVTQSSNTSGTQITGLMAGTPYYVTITANPPPATYLQRPMWGVRPRRRFSFDAHQRLPVRGHHRGIIDSHVLGAIKRPWWSGVHVTGLYQLRYVGGLRWPGVSCDRWPDHRPHGWHAVLRHGDGDCVKRLSGLSGVRRRRSDYVDRSTHASDQRLPGLRHGLGLDQGDLQRSSKPRAVRPTRHTPAPTPA